MSELKPCPFCGGEAALHPLITRINCSECNSVMSGVQGPAPLIKAWNTRPDLRAELVEAIAERYGELDYLRFTDVLEAINTIMGDSHE